MSSAEPAPSLGPQYRSTPTQTTEIPGGIPFIISNEAAERFSFYGMRAILTTFMTKYLVDASGNSDLMSQENATFWSHIFIFACYATPVLGAFLADFAWGKYYTIMRLSLVYCLGHLVLAWDASRAGLAIGLTLIAIGAGGIKPCVSAHVGDQFGSTNKHLLPKVFAWFYLAINLGATVASWLTPKLLEHQGPHWAFAVPGILMLMATWVFWMGRYEFVHIPPAGHRAFADLSTTEGMQALMRVALIFAFTVPFWSLFDQQSTTWVFQARYMDRTFLGIEWHEAQIQVANPILILIFVPVFTYAVYPFLQSFFNVTPLRKIAIGLFITVFCYALLARVEETMNGGRIVKHSSEAKQLNVENLLDGATTGENYWASKDVSRTPTGELGENSQHVIIRLRDSKPWPVDALVLHPVLEGAAGDGVNHAACRPRVLAVSVSSVPKGQGVWKEVARLEMQQQGGAQTFELPQPVDATYVQLEFLSNYGGPRVELSEIEVHTSGRTDVPAPARRTALGALDKMLRPLQQQRPLPSDANVAAIGERPSVRWQLLAYFILTAAEVMISITALEFAYTQAPRTMKSLVMTLYLLAVALGNAFTSIVNLWIEKSDGTSRLPGATYFWFFAVVMLITAVSFIGIAAGYRERSYIQGESDDPAPVT